MTNKKKKNEYTERPRPKAEYWNPDLCPVCGHNDFTWGKLSSSSSPTYFNPEGMFSGSRKMDARHCKRCGNVQLFAEKS